MQYDRSAEIEKSDSRLEQALNSLINEDDLKSIR
jgi:hypothetical protein